MIIMTPGNEHQSPVCGGIWNSWALRIWLACFCRTRNSTWGDDLSQSLLNGEWGYRSILLCNFQEFHQVYSRLSKRSGFSLSFRFLRIWNLASSPLSCIAIRNSALFEIQETLALPLVITYSECFFFLHFCCKKTLWDLTLQITGIQTNSKGNHPAPLSMTRRTSLCLIQNNIFPSI